MVGAGSKDRNMLFSALLCAYCEKSRRVRCSRWWAGLSAARPLFVSAKKRVGDAIGTRGPVSRGVGVIIMK